MRARSRQAALLFPLLTAAALLLLLYIQPERSEMLMPDSREAPFIDPPADAAYNPPPRWAPYRPAVKNRRPPKPSKKPKPRPLPPAPRERTLLLATQDPNFVHRVLDALDLGRNFLCALQCPDGSWLSEVWPDSAGRKYRTGLSALCLLALIKAGHPRSSESVQRGWRFLKDKPLRTTYETSLLLQVMKALGEPQDPESRISGKENEPVKPHVADRRLLRQAVDFLLRGQRSSGRTLAQGTEEPPEDVWSYPASLSRTPDHANTHFAVMGLNAGQHMGMRINAKVWSRTVEHLLKAQEENGPQVADVMVQDRYGLLVITEDPEKVHSARGWCYNARMEPFTGAGLAHRAATGSMTAASTAALAAALSYLGGARPLSRKQRLNARTAVRNGQAWLEHHWTVLRNPQDPGHRWHYFYLWMVERTAAVLNLRNLGVHDWYGKGAEFLLGQQALDGSWDDLDCPGPVTNTCFALLFLSRSSAR